jgi:hypothetical protein
MKFRYKYEHLNCASCLDLSKAPCCPHTICPYILDHLEDLRHDPAFNIAVARADSCGNYHRPALLLLQKGTASCLG